MASKQEHDRYAAELTRRFEEFTRWAISNWPDKRFPLVQSDFRASRREIAEIAGPKLGEGEPEHVEAGSSTGHENTAPGIPVGMPQFVDVTPAPWP